jgi:hypothetical protein
MPQNGSVGTRTIPEALALDLVSSGMESPLCQDEEAISETDEKIVVDHRPQKPTGESRKSQAAQIGNGIKYVPR